MIKELSSLQHPLVKHLAKLQHNRDYRYEHHSVVVEGRKMIDELVKTQPVKCLVATDLALLAKYATDYDCFLITEPIFKKISGMVNPEGLLAEVAIPPLYDLKDKNYIVALDNISDPGNIGTILRNALALGWEGVFLIGDCCDPFNDKALRAARGATFRIPLAYGSWKDLEQLSKKQNGVCLAADIVGTPLHAIETPKKALLVLGNEARGVSAPILDFCRQVTIPMQGPMESLNVSSAGAILMHHLKGKSV